MKQTLFLIAMMAYFTFRSIADPFWAVLMYYGLDVLRPQFIWWWALPPGVRWSLYAAVVAIVFTTLHIGSLGRCAVQKSFIAMLVLFAVCIAGSYASAMDMEIAARYGIRYAKILLMLFVASLVVTEPRHFRYLGWMIFLCLIYLVYEMNAYYVFDRRLAIYRGYGGLDNNGIGLTLAMVIPFCYYFFQAERRWWRWGYLICIIPSAHVIMLSFSRGAMLSAIMVAVGMLLPTARKRFIQTATLAAAIVLVGLALAGPEVRARFLSMSKQERDASIRSRFDSWKAGWAMAKDHPLFGVGLRNSNLLIKDYGADKEGRTIHNVYLQIAADSGITAAAIFIAMVAMALWWLNQAARKTDPLADDPRQKWHHFVCRAAFWSLATFALGAVFLSLENLELCYLLMLMGAAAPALAERLTETQETSSAPAREGLPQPAQLSAGGVSI